MQNDWTPKLPNSVNPPAFHLPHCRRSLPHCCRHFPHCQCPVVVFQLRPLSLWMPWNSEDWDGSSSAWDLPGIPPWPYTRCNPPSFSFPNSPPARTCAQMHTWETWRHGSVYPGIPLNSWCLWMLFNNPPNMIIYTVLAHPHARPDSALEHQRNAKLLHSAVLEFHQTTPTCATFGLIDEILLLASTSFLSTSFIIFLYHVFIQELCKFCQDAT